MTKRNTMTLKKLTRTAPNGAPYTVWTEKAVERSAGGWLGGTDILRTWARNEATGEELELEAVFHAASAVRKAGW